MAVHYPHADHLITEEIDYELKLRGKLAELRLDREVKNRMVRNLLLEDMKENKTYDQVYTIDQEYDNACAKIKYLSQKLEKGFEQQYISRLCHYYHRILRTKPSEPMGEKMRWDILEMIRQILNKHTDSKSSKGQQENVPEERQSDREGAVGGERSQKKDDWGDMVELEQRVVPEKEINPVEDIKVLGTRKRDKKPIETSVEQSLKNRIDELEKQLLRACLAWSGVERPLTENINLEKDECDMVQGNRERMEERIHSRQSELEDETKVVPTDEWLRGQRRKQKEQRESLWDDRRRRDSKKESRHYQYSLDRENFADYGREYRETSVNSRYSDRYSTKGKSPPSGRNRDRTKRQESSPRRYSTREIDNRDQQHNRQTAPRECRCHDTVSQNQQREVNSRDSLTRERS